MPEGRRLCKKLSKQVCQEEAVISEIAPDIDLDDLDLKSVLSYDSDDNYVICGYSEYDIFLNHLLMKMTIAVSRSNKCRD